MIAFESPIETAAELRQLVGEPTEVVHRMKLDALDHYQRDYIARSPFALLASSNARGDLDVAPRGDPAGFVRVVDDSTLLLPERPGNRRADTLTNILENPHVGLLFLVPGVGEALRVNGRARLIRDADLLTSFAVQGKAPLLVIAITVQECYCHCARAALRAHHWDPTTWPDPKTIPSIARIAIEEAKVRDITVAQLDHDIEQEYKELY
jgi:PPOX class probable FMN-dependent enzyme